MLYFAENVEILYVSSILMALALGFSNAPSLAYAGEVCEPKLRGALTSALNIFFYAGSIILTTMYSITMQWRLTVLLVTVFPILTIAILLTVIRYANRYCRRLYNNQPKTMICFRHQILRCGCWPRENIQKHTETSAGWEEKFRTKNVKTNFKKWSDTTRHPTTTNRVILLILRYIVYFVLFYYTAS